MSAFGRSSDQGGCPVLADSRLNRTGCGAEPSEERECFLNDVLRLRRDLPVANRVGRDCAHVATDVSQCRTFAIVVALEKCTVKADPEDRKTLVLVDPHVAK